MSYFHSTMKLRVKDMIIALSVLLHRFPSIIAPNHTK